MLFNMSNKFSEQIKGEIESLWKFAMRLSNNPQVAEELVQKTILRSLEKKHQFSEGTKLRSWLFKILHSIWKNDLRKQAIRSKFDFNTVEVDSVESNNQTVEENLFFKQVVKQVNLLPEAQRVAMILVCVDGYSYKETAEILDIPEGTVMSRIARARLKIGRKFQTNEQPNSALDVKELRS